MYENHTQNCLEDEFLGPHCTCVARPMENEGPKRRAEVCALADQLGLVLQRRIATLYDKLLVVACASVYVKTM